MFDFGIDEDFDSIVPSTQASGFGSGFSRGTLFSSMESSFSGKRNRFQYIVFFKLCILQCILRYASLLCVFLNRTFLQSFLR